MASNQEHLQRAQQNEAFFTSLDIDTTPYRDWILIGVFLASLHYVQSVLVGRGITCKDHRTRNSHLTIPELLPIAKAYLELKDHNELARYELVDYTSNDIRNTIFPLFQQLKRHISSLPL